LTEDFEMHIHNMIFFLMDMIKGSLQDELDYFPKPFVPKRFLVELSPRAPSPRPGRNSIIRDSLSWVGTSSPSSMITSLSEMERIMDTGHHI